MSFKMLNFVKRRRQSLTEADAAELKQTIHRLVSLSTHEYGYYLFLVLSVLITTAGLLIGSSPVIIGGMIIAPLLTPLLACGLALYLLESRGLLRAVVILLYSIIIAILLSAGLTLLVEKGEIAIQYLPPKIPPQLYLVIAFSSGIAGAFAFVRSDLSASLSGVAVSVSLLPPLCAIGIGAVLRDAVLVRGAALIFSLNVAGIILASSFVFWQLGFREVRKLEMKEVEKVDER